MDIEKIIEAIENKTESGANYKRTRGPPGKQIRDYGKRIRVGDKVVARCYERDGGETFYEIYERHMPVFQLIKKEDRYFIRQPVAGKWIQQLELEYEDVFGRQRTEEQGALEELAAQIIDKAWILVRRGKHFDESQEEVRTIGRMYQNDGIGIRLMRIEKGAESSPTFLDVWQGEKNLVFSAEMTNDKQKVIYNGNTEWTEEFLKLK